jgi:hypothetical protein
MQKKEYLGDINSSELCTLFENKHRVKSLIDLKKTLQAPSPVVKDMLDGLSIAQIDAELKEAKGVKEKLFSNIYNKYIWMKTINPEQIYISEDGKVYKTCSHEKSRSTRT